MILMETTKKYTMITICNYDNYNDPEPTSKQRMTNRRPTDDQQMNTYNKGNNDNNDKEGLLASPEKEKFDAFTAWLKENAPNVLKMKEPLTLDQYTELTKRIGKIGGICKRMHNHQPLLKKNVSAYLTIINWHERDLQQQRA
jgi:hypothetical protein